MEERKIDAVISKIMIVLLMVSIAVACSIQKLLDPVLHVEINEKIWLLGLELLILFLLMLNRSLLRHWKKIKWLWAISGLDCVMILTGAYNSMILNGMPLRVTIFYSVPYFYALLSVPIALLLINSDLKLKQLLQWIVICSMVSYGIRIFISWYFGKTGTVGLPSIALEGAAANWIRNGVLRINPPVFVSLLLPGIAYLFLESKENWKRVLYLLSGIIIFYFTYKIHQARSIMVYQVLTLVVIWLASRKKITWKEGVVLAVLAVLVMRTEKFQEFVYSLSLKNTGEDATTACRVNALQYFGNEYLKAPVLGLGYLDGESGLAAGGGHIADIGLLQTVFTMGLPGMLYVVLFLIRSGENVLLTLLKRIDRNLLVLTIGIVCSFWMHNINMDTFGGYLANTVPVFLGLMEYGRVSAKRMMD